MTGVYSVLFCKYSNYSVNILHSDKVDNKKVTERIFLIGNKIYMSLLKTVTNNSQTIL